MRIRRMDGPCSQHGDTDLIAGQRYGVEINRRLAEARAVVVLWSKTSVTRPWVHAESHVGFDRQVLNPAMVELCGVPAPFNILHTPRLMDWAKKRTDTLPHDFLAALDALTTDADDRSLEQAAALTELSEARAAAIAEGAEVDREKAAAALTEAAAANDGKPVRDLEQITTEHIDHLMDMTRRMMENLMPGGSRRSN